MKNIFQMVVGILIAQAITYLLGNFKSPAKEMMSKLNKKRTPASSKEEALEVKKKVHYRMGRMFARQDYV